MDAKAFIRDAAEFFVSAVAIDDAMVDDQGFEILSPRTAYYLASHSIELALKAVLVNAGQDESQLRALGHNLTNVLQAANAAGLNAKLTADEENLIALLNSAYKNFRYPGGPIGNLPIWGPLTVVMIKVLEAAIAKVPNSEAAIRAAALNRISGFISWRA